jgi:hypothetical protein
MQINQEYIPHILAVFFFKNDRHCNIMDFLYVEIFFHTEAKVRTGSRLFNVQCIAFFARFTVKYSAVNNICVICASVANFLTQFSHITCVHFVRSLRGSWCTLRLYFYCAKASASIRQIRLISVPLNHRCADFADYLCALCAISA